MTKCDKVADKQDVIDYLVDNKEYLAQICSDLMMDYEARRSQFLDFLLEYNTALIDKIKAKIADEVSQRLACDRELISIVLDEVGVEWLNQ